MIKTVKRFLKESEIKLLMEDIKLYPDLVYIKKELFKKLKKTYVVEVNKKLAGICGIYEIEDWVKLGPLVFLKKYHGKGYGKILLSKIVGDYPGKKLFITSSNIAVQKIVSKLNFQEVESYFNLPTIVKLFLIKQLFEYFHWELIVEFLRKKFTMKRNKRMYYIMNK